MSQDGKNGPRPFRGAWPQLEWGDQGDLVKRTVFGSVFLLTSVAVLLSFNNCAKPQSTPLIDPSLLSIDADEEVPTESLKIVSHEATMNCFEDHVQLGGVCHPGEGTSNYIEISLKRDGTPVGWASANGGTVGKITNIPCENGRFFVVIPRPNDGLNCCRGPNCLSEYRVESQIFVSEDGLQFRAGNKATSFPILIQPVGSCTRSLDKCTN